VNKDKEQGQPEAQYNLLVRTRVTLNLTTVGEPNPKLSLFKKASNGVYREQDSSRFLITFFGIIISSVEPEDEGEYRLTALSDFEGEVDNEEFTISVISKYLALYGSYSLMVVNN